MLEWYHCVGMIVLWVVCMFSWSLVILRCLSVKVKDRKISIYKEKNWVNHALMMIHYD